MPNDQDYQELWSRARAEGALAALKVVPTPMRVFGLDGTLCDVVPEGEFGTVFVLLSPKDPFAKWVVRSRLGRRAPDGFVRIAICRPTDQKEHAFYLQRSRVHAEVFCIALRGGEVQVEGIVESSD